MTDVDVDLRLAFPLMCLWAAMVGTFAWAGSARFVGFLAAAMLAAIWLVAHRVQMLWLAALLSLIAIMIALSQWRLIHSPQATRFIEETPIATLVFKPTSDGVVSQQRGFSALDFARETRFRAETESVDGKALRLPILVTAPADDLRIVLGSAWSCAATLSAAEGAINVVAYARCRGEPQKVRDAPAYQQWATELRESLVRASALRHPQVDGALLLPGLVLGDTSAQSPEVERALRVAGLGHLTAVSGANVAIVIGGVSLLLSLFPIPRRARFVILIATVLIFMVVVRPSPSVVRASAMAIVALSLWLVGQRKHAESTLLVTAIVLLLIDPWLALSWGFALSVAATLGLVVLPRLWGVDASSRLLKRALMTALAASVATTPVLFMMGAVPSLGTVPANVLADVFVAPATIAGVLAALFSFAHIDFMAHLLADFATLMAQAIVVVAKVVSDSTLATSLLSWQGLLLAAALILMWLYRGKLWLIVFGTCLILVLASLSSSRPWAPHDWELLVCDVGQGDASLLRTGPTSAMVIDSGGDPDLIDSCLDQADVGHVSLFVASHFHQDHVGGFVGVVRSRTVDRVLTSAFARPEMGRELIRQNISVPIEVASVGMTGSSPRVQWKVLMATNPGTELQAQPDGTTINSSSVVLLVHTRHWRILFTGDLETAAQEQLMSSLSAPAVDLVKIPHHGSRFQSEAFAAWVSADAAWASVGANNAYGHPNQQALNRFRQSGALVLTTMDCGAIAATSGRSLVSERQCNVG